MTYTTLAQLETRYGAREILDLADRDRDGVADAGVVEAAIAEADQIIDAYLRNRYEVPLTTVPGLIASCANVLARYYLASDLATERVETDYKQALAWLKSVREGTMDPGIDALAAAPEAETGGPQHSPGREAFPSDALDRWAGQS